MSKPIKYSGLSFFDEKVADIRALIPKSPEKLYALADKGWYIVEEVK